MSTATAVQIGPPRVLGPEPWGSRMSRARKEAGVSSIHLFDRVRTELGFGRGPVHELEQMHEAPTEPEQRRRAYVLVAMYGYDPADFELGDDDRPKLVDLRAVRDLGEAPTKWYVPVTRIHARRPLAAVA